MSSLSERVPLDRIGERARRARPGRAVAVAAATMLAAVLVGAGWAACKIFAVLAAVAVGAWRAAVWCGSAVVEGWQSARSGQRAP